MQLDKPQQPPHEVPTSPNYVRKVLQLAGNADHVASFLLWGDCSNSNLIVTSIVSGGTEILMMWELIVKPSASIVVSQAVLILGARMGVTPTPLRPNKRP